MPRRASCQAASQPASPPPMMVTRSVIAGSRGGGPPRRVLHELALAAAEQAADSRGHRLVEGLHVLALWVARAAEELPVAAEADLHGAAALLAHLAGGLGLDRPDGPVVGVPEVLRVLALRVAAAGEELAPPAPLDDHRLPALLAHEVGRALLALHVAHQDLGLLEVPGEWPPEAAERVDVVLLALLDAVELVLHAGRELDVQHVGERLDQEVGHQEAQLGRLEAPLVVLEHVLLVEDGAHDAGIGGRAPDALLLELLHERRLCEAGRRLREVLLGDQLEEAQPVALGERRELTLALLLGIALLVVAALGVDADEAVELEDLAGGTEAAAARLDVHRAW